MRNLYQIVKNKYQKKKENNVNNLIPKQVDIAFDNVNEIMEAMTTQGQKDLDIYYNKENIILKKFQN